MLIYPNLFSESFPLQTGKWDVEFQEVYHPKNLFWPLCEISFDPLDLKGLDESQQRFHNNAFSIVSRIETKKDPTSGKSQEGNSIILPDYEFREAVQKTFSSDKHIDEWLPSFANEMQKGLASVLVRCGILRPIFDSAAINELKKTHGSIIIPDTNSIVNGAFHYICRTYANSIGYVALPEDVEQELRKKAIDFKDKVDSTLKSIRNAKEFNRKNSATDLLKLRPFGQNAFVALRRERLPVEYEIVPIQASSIKAAGGDEEIIRTVAEFLRLRHISAPVFFLTYDYNMARFCNLRGWSVIFCRQPKIKPDQAIYSVRYDYRSDRFIIVDMVEFLWEATYAFNCLRITSEDKTISAVLHSCKEGVSYRNWTNDQMELTVSQETPHPSASHATGKLYKVSLETFLRGIFGYFKEDIPISNEAWKEHLKLGSESLREYLSFGRLLGLWDIVESGEIRVLPSLQDFIDLWRRDGLIPIRERIQTCYPVFISFYNFLAQRREVRLDDRESLKESGLQIKCLKYFPKACELLNIGRIFDRKLLWTGAEISLDEFWQFLVETYSQIRGGRDFVGMDELINAAYRKLNISHELFKDSLAKLLVQNPDTIETSGTVALASDRWNAFTVICPLKEAGFLEKINLEDGFVIGSRTIKAIYIRV